MSLNSAFGGEEPVLVGRDREVALLTSALESARSAGMAVLIEGEPGIGKSALLTAMTRHAEDTGYRVLRCTGVEQASPTGYASLHELLRPLLRRLDALPVRQREALATAFGLAEGPAPDRLLVSIAALGLLEEAARASPLLIAVEDLHWIDTSTRHVVEFIGLRLEESPVALLATSRTSWGSGALSTSLWIGSSSSRWTTVRRARSSPWCRRA
ncbi:ATP-binding protein [Rathayibacter oskolensis]|uniref:ATP-binding protein n=1 Tax=Rathayibacter oskolensis TaxID=1891671 RepID=UPI0026603649|nr:ATP-binding protein [Rathayibacter oskolensis]WKK72772.1 ATP-binding protein [Rathayibacter oskolensis]